MLQHWLSMGVAYGQTAAPKGPSTLEMLIMPAGFVLIMYFFMFRPQARKAREQAEFMKGLKVGEEVLTTGGIIGRVKSVSDTFVTVDIAANTSIKVLKTHLSAMVKPKEAAKELATAKK
jgi:preprotein translocase subunit YajC